MKILVVGNGAREHAICWKLKENPDIDVLFAAPGNAGTANIARNVPISPTSIKKLVKFAEGNSIDLTVIGPEGPLAEGIVNRFQEAGLLAFGPTKEAARIETSKTYAKNLMLRNSIPTAYSKTFSTYSEASLYVGDLEPPIVVKADGLAAGKGVVIASTHAEAVEALHQQMEERTLGTAGDCVLIEEHIEGQEISVFSFVDGEHVSRMVAACDYKRVHEGDVGPNTGGMGSYSPPLVWDSELENKIRLEIMEPIAKALVEDGSHYQGVLYAGLMLTEEGPKVLEFNCRLGDPETQVILPRLKTDLLQVMMCTAEGSLEKLTINWDPIACVGVVLASRGYPDKYLTGYQISGLDQLTEQVEVFHAGTKVDETKKGTSSRSILTGGGRVLTVSASGESLKEARRKVYQEIEHIHFEGSFYRSDIADIF